MGWLDVRRHLSGLDPRPAQPAPVGTVAAPGTRDDGSQREIAGAATTEAQEEHGAGRPLGRGRSASMSSQDQNLLSKETRVCGVSAAP